MKGDATNVIQDSELRFFASSCSQISLRRVSNSWRGNSVRRLEENMQREGEAEGKGFSLGQQ